MADAQAELGELDLAQVEELSRLAPFGSSNRAPVVVIPGSVVRTSRQVGQGHLQLTLSQGTVWPTPSASAWLPRRPPTARWWTWSPARKWTPTAAFAGRACGSKRSFEEDREMKEPLESTREKTVFDFLPRKRLLAALSLIVVLLAVLYARRHTGGAIEQLQNALAPAAPTAPAAPPIPRAPEPPNHKRR